MSAKSRSEGEQALIEARRIESEQNRRLNEISKQIQNAKIMEEHIAQVHFLIVFHVYKWSAVINWVRAIQTECWWNHVHLSTVSK